MSSTSNSANWDFILGTLKSEKCILFLGPEIYTGKNGKKLYDALAGYLDLNKSKDIIQNYYPGEGLYLFTSKGKKTVAFYKIQSFYQQDFPEAEVIFEKIARIPFHLLISMTPDRVLDKTFTKLNLKHKFDFYWKNQTPTSEAYVPSAANPLIYNIFGSVDQQESMLLTHADLFDYFDSIFGERSLPLELKKILKNADNYIFLGLEYDKWYLQLLLRILSLHSENLDFERYAASQSTDDQVRTFCNEQFKIEFISNNIGSFVDELYNRCEQAGILRQAGAPQKSIIELLKNFLAMGEIEEVFQPLLDFLEMFGEKAKELFDIAIQLSGRLNRLQKKQMEGIIEPEKASIESNQISKSLLELLDKAQLFE